MVSLALLCVLLDIPSCMLFRFALSSKLSQQLRIKFHVLILILTSVAYNYGIGSLHYYVSHVKQL